MVASSGAQLLEDDAVEVARRAVCFPLATVVTPNLLEARALTAVAGVARQSWPRGSWRSARSAAVVTGGHGGGVGRPSLRRERASRDPGRAERRWPRHTGPGARTPRRSPRSSPAGSRCSTPLAVPPPPRRAPLRRGWWRSAAAKGRWTSWELLRDEHLARNDAARAARAEAARPPDHELRGHERDGECDPRARRAAGDGARAGGGRGDGRARVRARAQHRHALGALDRGDADRGPRGECARDPRRPRSGRRRRDCLPHRHGAADPRRGGRDGAPRQCGRGRDARRRRRRGARRRVDRRRDRGRPSSRERQDGSSGSSLR